MKKKIIFLCFVLILVSLNAIVVFYDDFERPDGDVGNDWQFNTPPSLTNSKIQNGVFHMDLVSTGNAYHNFTSQTSGVVYVQYDWQLITNEWTSCVYPVDESIYIRCDWQGNISYDDNSSFTSPTPVTQINFAQWYNVKFSYDLDNDTFSFWLNETLLLSDIASNSVTTINSFNFLNINAPNFVQEIDNFKVYNDTPPEIPTGLSATEHVNDITLQWNPVSNPLLVTYEIYRDETSPAATLIDEVASPDTFYVDTTALPNTDYFYRIKACSEGLCSDFSVEIEQTHLAPDIDVSTNILNIDVGYGYQETQSFTIYNNGNYDLTFAMNGSLKDALVAYYPFKCNANDASEFDNNGMVDGPTPSDDRFGNQESSYYFDGINDIIVLDHTENINFDGFTDSYSVVCWARSNTAENARILEKWDSGHANYPITIHTNIDGGVSGGIYDSINNPKVNIAHPWDGQWHMLTFIVDNDSDLLLSYYDDSFRYSKLNTTTSSTANTSSVFIGNSTYVGDRYFEGYIDEIRFYNKTLNQFEIAALYNETSSEYLTLDSYTGQISARGSYEVHITIDASELQIGTYTDTLNIFSNDSESYPLEIIINTNVLPPEVDVQEDSYEFTLNNEITSYQEELHLENIGEGSLDYFLKCEDNFPSEPNISGYSFIGEYNGHYYYYSDDMANWADAYQNCLDVGGYLATLESQQENDFVVHPTETCWIGFTDNEDEGIWKNVNGQIIWIGDENGSPYQNAFTNWSPGEPNDSGNSGVENYATMYYGNYPDEGGMWNDESGDHVRTYILEIESPLSFVPSYGNLDSANRDQETILITAHGNGLNDGIFTTMINIEFNNDSQSPYTTPVTINKDFTPPLQVQNLVFTSSTTEEIRIDWDANAIEDSTEYYNVYRRSNDESGYSLLDTTEDTFYIDTYFTGLDTTYFWYKVSAVDWVANEGTESDPCQANLNRFKAPENLQISMINNDKDVLLNWDPVTETISGLPGTPTCYIVYYNEEDPNDDNLFYFLSIAEDTTYTHQYVGCFTEDDRMFYMVTAYGGTLRSIMSYFDENGIIYDIDNLSSEVKKLEKNIKTKYWND